MWGNGSKGPRTINLGSRWMIRSSCYLLGLTQHALQERKSQLPSWQRAEVQNQLYTVLFHDTTGVRGQLVLFQSFLNTLYPQMRYQVIWSEEGDG